MFIFLTIPAITVAFSLGIAKALVPRLQEAGINGEDVHKEDLPKIPEMGGLVLVTLEAIFCFLGILYYL